MGAFGDLFGNVWIDTKESFGRNIGNFGEAIKEDIQPKRWLENFGENVGSAGGSAFWENFNKGLNQSIGGLSFPNQNDPNFNNNEIPKYSFTFDNIFMWVIMAGVFIALIALIRR